MRRCFAIQTCTNRCCTPYKKQVNKQTKQKQNKNELEADDQNSEIHYRGLFCLFQMGQAKIKLPQTALTINKRQNGRN